MTPIRFRLGNGPAEVTQRAAEAGSLAGDQQTLGADPAIGGTDPFGDQVGKRIGALGSRWPWRRRPGSALDNASNGLWRCPAELRGGPEAAEPLVCGQDVQLVPR
jgi:hypothetical protein